MALPSVDREALEQLKAFASSAISHGGRATISGRNCQLGGSLEDLAAAMDLICKETAAEDYPDDPGLEQQASLAVDPLTAALAMGAIRKPKYASHLLCVCRLVPVPQ